MTNFSFHYGQSYKTEIEFERLVPRESRLDIYLPARSPEESKLPFIRIKLQGEFPADAEISIRPRGIFLGLQEDTRIFSNIYQALYYSFRKYRVSKNIYFKWFSFLLQYKDTNMRMS